jgi:3-(methylthio)propionyl---CoA ligase
MTCGVPTVWLGLLHHLRASGEKLATVTRIMTGGSAAPPLLIEAFRDEFGVTVEHGWGMTELSPVGTYNAPKPGLSGDEAVRHMLKQGHVLAGIDMKIVDGDGHELPWDGKQFGDLMVRGPWVCSGYYGEAPGSACDAEGWFATGDVATIDPDGTMEITDRSKDVIKSGGEWISSITLENIAVSHPDVAEAAVVAALHPKWDERPLLLVVARPGHTVDPASVLQMYQGQVPKWWLPDEVVVVAELPHTATGKLLKTELRTRYRDHYRNTTTKSLNRHSFLGCVTSPIAATAKVASRSSPPQYCSEHRLTGRRLTAGTIPARQQGYAHERLGQTVHHRLA